MWVKKGRDLFDADMGVGTFLLEKITEICNKSEIGLYSDDGLSLFRKKWY